MPVTMDKRVEAATVSLTKAAQRATTDLGDVTAQVTLEVDHSLSMDELYRNGTVQEVVERALALSMTGLDDDKIVPVTFFDDRAYEPIEVTDDRAVYARVVDDFRRKHRMGGTRYAPAIDHALGASKRGRFRKGPDERDAPPNLHLFVTDGAPSDAAATQQRLIDARSRPHFFQIVVVGGNAGALAFCQHLNDHLTEPTEGCQWCRGYPHAAAAGIDNVGVFECRDPKALSDEQFFDGVVNEFFPTWLPAARAAGYTRR